MDQWQSPSHTTVSWLFHYDLSHPTDRHSLVCTNLRWFHTNLHSACSNCRLPRQIRTESLYVSWLVMHHHHCCLAPQQCVVPVVASSRQSGRVWAIFTASVNLSLWGLRSSGTVFIHVITGRPLFQSGCRHDVLASALSGSLTLDHCLNCLGWVC